MTPSTALMDLADRWGLRLSEEKWEGYRLACEAIVRAAVDAETERCVHAAKAMGWAGDALRQRRDA